MALCFSLYTHLIEAGVDEVGRGCLAGDVFAAATILPKDFFHPLLNDSKQVKSATREELAIYIKKHAIAYHIASVNVEKIESINILQATFLAMHKAIDGLQIIPEHLAIDGNKFNPYKNIAHTCCKKGDAHYMHIAAASILAKTTRDAYMQKLHYKFPQYHWDNNKGYGTKQHFEAILKYGITKYHRQSFLKNLYVPKLEF